VKELAPAAPPAAAPPPPAPAPRPARAARVAHAGSAPEGKPAASAPEEAASASHEQLKAEALALAASVAEAERAASAAQAAAAASATMAASAAAAPPLASASAPLAGPPQPALDWPPSTRLTYTLTGIYQGRHLYGKGLVEWRRDGAHYQVQFDFSLTPWFEQHMLSDGRIADDGLRPDHYSEDRKFLFRDARSRKVEFGDDDVQLSNGKRVPRLAQSQDSASQFVQFVWMFTTHPDWLQQDRLVEIPLALPFELRRWQYRVGALESLDLPFGPVDAVHLSPVGPFRANEYPFEIWVAPTLQYLPVHVHVMLGDPESYADLALDSRPLQSAPVAAPPLPRPPSAPDTRP
jgi:hypothetical protein